VNFFRLIADSDLDKAPWEVGVDGTDCEEGGDDELREVELCLSGNLCGVDGGENLERGETKALELSELASAVWRG